MIRSRPDCAAVVCYPPVAFLSEATGAAFREATLLEIQYPKIA
jgi:hypothetical protein